jgi:hypothetical protein
MKKILWNMITVSNFGSAAFRDKKAVETEHIALKWTGKTISSILFNEYLLVAGSAVAPATAATFPYSGAGAFPYAVAGATALPGTIKNEMQKLIDIQ